MPPERAPAQSVGRREPESPARSLSAILATPTDIFPEIDIPVVSVIWNYEGLSTEEMASRITTFSEYTISSVVGDVRTIQSQPIVTRREHLYLTLASDARI